MFFKKDPRTEALLEMALKQVEKMLREMTSDGKDLAKLKLKKYQKTHYTDCLCPKCNIAKKKNNPHLRGLLEEGFKVYVGEGGGEED
ncbi:MAG: hypothetical protein OEV94_01320 [Deltaproteobacteria bacterium]|nr:hypothetical protein [Deltaproteobacteria bacterium]